MGLKIDFCLFGPTPAPPYHTRKRCDKEGGFLKRLTNLKYLSG